jgi:ABC-2 type transport system permease protein
MFGKIAAFEFRYQIRSPVFWVGAFFFALLSFGLVASANVSLGGGGAIHKNAPWALGVLCLALSLWYMLITTAFVANVVVRDDETGFGSIVRSTPISKFSYLIGRFTGAYGAAALAFLSVPLGVFVGTLMPWVDQETIGPNALADYAYAYFLLGLPSVLLTSALFFTVATVTRSMMWSYIGVIVFICLYIVLNVVVGRKPEWELGSAFAEPFGTQAFSYVTKYWTVDDRNAGMPPFAGVLLANRLIVIGASLVLLAIGYNLFRTSTRGAKLRKHQKLQAMAAKSPAPTPTGRLPQPRFDGATIRAQLFARTRFEMKQIFTSPAYAILLILGLAFSFLTLWLGGELYGVHAYPSTVNIITALAQGLLSVLILVIATYYAGELVWRERDRKVHEIIGAAAIPGWAFIVPKMIALSLVMVSTVVASAAAGVLVQTARGYTNYAFDEYLFWYVLPYSLDYVLVAVFAIFLAVIAPHKFIGWGLMVVYIISTIVLSSLGFSDQLYHFGSAPDVPLSDMNGQGRFWKAAAWFRGYWTAFTLLLAVLSYALWRRGAETRLMPQIKALPRRLTGPAGVIAGLAALAFIGLGVWLFINTHVWNTYRSNLDVEKQQAAYETTLYNKFKDTPHPSIVSMKLDVDLHPHEPSMTTRGSYVIENRTGAPLSEIHVRMNPDNLTKSWTIDLPGSHLKASPKSYEDFKYRIYTLDTPMAPGERRTLGFTTLLAERGISNGSGTTRLVDNGTFITNFEFAPVLGMDRNFLLQERTKRRHYGLPAELRPPTLEQDSPAVRARNYLGRADWMMSDITIHTDADQTPIAPGYRASDTTAGGRRTARFVTDTPVLGFFSIQSARYLQKVERYKGVDLVVFYDPHHPQNVDRMIKALKLSLDYYQANFSPFQFRQARVSEFPALGRGSYYAQSFPNIFPWSEGLGFTADVSDPNKIDYVTYVGAHEFGHQWWAYQVIGADMQGDTMLSETMAQYSALMVMEKLYGPDHIRKFLKYELDSYLRGRGSETLEELPLMRVENQGYIHYRKGAVAMYLLKDQIGEEAVNRALRKLLAQYAFKSAPFPSSKELVAYLRAEAPAEQQQLITDLFVNITLWDVRATHMTVTKRADGKFDVRLTIDAKKFTANGKGKEKPAAMKDESFDVGLFMRKPEDKDFGTHDVVLFQRMPLSTGEQSFSFVTDRRPAWGGVDPYSKRIDRNPNDNLAPAQ